jgi:hypothetical protein
MLILWLIYNFPLQIPKDKHLNKVRNFDYGLTITVPDYFQPQFTSQLSSHLKEGCNYKHAEKNLNSVLYC